MITIFHDSNCILCRRYKQALELIVHDQIVWIDIHSDDCVAPDGLSKSDLLQEIHIISAENVLLKGSDAVQYLMSAIPAAKRFSWLIESDSAKKAIDVFHSTSDKLRRRLINSCPSCKNKTSSL
ncbi:MAG: hypothetical protein CME71_00935 [Halobacteriovorax sp.]|nr:hypothetical protein [Halobacteriovorax sp.]